MRSPSTDISYTVVADGNILGARLTPGPGKTLISLPFSMFYTHPALVSRSFLLEATQIRLSCAQSCWAYGRSRVFTAHLFGIARLDYKDPSGGAFVPFPFLMRVCTCVIRGRGLSLCTAASAHRLHTWGPAASLVSQLVSARAGEGRGDIISESQRTTGNRLHKAESTLMGRHLFTFVCFLWARICINRVLPR